MKSMLSQLSKQQFEKKNERTIPKTKASGAHSFDKKPGFCRLTKNQYSERLLKIFRK